MAKVRRTPSDLRQELIDQLDLLTHACESYDAGREVVAKHIAVSLRVLLHHHRQSQSLFNQLRLTGKHFLSTSRPFFAGNLLGEFPLCIAVIGAESKWRPRLDEPHIPPHDRPRWLRFPDWWGEPVIRLHSGENLGHPTSTDIRGKVFNRREIVQQVANTDGGAHVDPKLDEAYMRLSRQDGFGVTFVQNDDVLNLGGPHLACVRQIAHELFRTLDVKHAIRPCTAGPSHQSRTGR